MVGLGACRSQDLSNVLIVGKDTIQVRRPGQTGVPQIQVRSSSPKALTIGVSELHRIRNTAKLQNKAEEMAEKKRKDAAKAAREGASNKRKEKMALMEEERKMRMKQAELEADVVTGGVLEKAKMQLEEQKDDVKAMNAMMMYSKVVTIRDAQVQEKRYIHQEREEEEAQLDTMMEIERLKALKMYEERNRARLIDQRKGAQVIVEQIKDRQAQRLREEEARDQERNYVLKQITAMKQEELEGQKAKRMAAAKYYSYS